jgi:hypothetical protein
MRIFRKLYRVFVELEILFRQVVYGRALRALRAAHRERHTR